MDMDHRPLCVLFLDFVGQVAGALFGRRVRRIFNGMRAKPNLPDEIHSAAQSSHPNHTFHHGRRI